MPRRTEDGVRVRRQVLGLRSFLQQAERTGMERLGMRDLAHFERLLPYAFALGVAEAWAEGFADLEGDRPGWLSGRSGEPCRPCDLVRDVGRCLGVTGRVLGASTRGPREWWEAIKEADRPA